MTFVCVPFSSPCLPDPTHENRVACLPAFVLPVLASHFSACLIMILSVSSVFCGMVSKICLHVQRQIHVDGEPRNAIWCHRLQRHFCVSL